MKLNSFDTSQLTQPRWCWRQLIVCNVIALLLMASWLWQPTRALWDSFDALLFHWLNAPLANHPIWATIWAIGNMRPVDAAIGLVMLIAIIKSDFIFSGAQVRRALYAFLALLLLMLLIRIVLFDQALKLLQWKRASPSLVVDGAVRLTELFPSWKQQWALKDSSEQCFPGDHASVLFIWTAMLLYFARGKALFFVWLLTILYALPRLIAGAHWGSDVFVGGAFLSLMAFGWGYYTPYVASAQNWLERITAPLMKILVKLPILRNFSVISGQ
jgi:membrane-associated phospholipid phosphatase